MDDCSLKTVKFVALSTLPTKLYPLFQDKGGVGEYERLL
jgi:hypothetical protein